MSARNWRLSFDGGGSWNSIAYLSGLSLPLLPYAQRTPEIPQLEKRHDVQLAADDVAKLLAAATDERYRVAILLAAEVGLRIGEIRGLQWGCRVEAARAWVVGTLDGELLSYWTALEATHGVYSRAGVAIPVSETGMSMPWHSLRHTFGTKMAKRVPLPALQKLMGTRRSRRRCATSK